ncbi:hypothetical protein JCM3765_003784 [Sporobolomyces pararoseus]
MPFIIPGREESPSVVQSVKLGPYFRLFTRNLFSTIQAATRATVPTHLALDGWSAAVQCFDALLPINPKLQFDPIISFLLSKTISPRQSDFETIVWAPCAIDTATESQNFERWVEGAWNRLCVVENRHGPIDHVELDFTCSPSNRFCRAQLRRYLPFPLNFSKNPSSSASNIDLNPVLNLEPFFYTYYLSHGIFTLPKSSVFFFSRLEYLRHLSHQIDIFTDHHHSRNCSCTTKLDLVQDRISQVVLQMLVYYRSMSQSEGTLRVLNSDYLDWIKMVDLGTRFDNETFGNWGFQRNWEFLQAKEEEFEKVWERAASWAYPEGGIERNCIETALKEMEHWVVTQFKKMKSYEIFEKTQQSHESDTEGSSRRFIPRARASTRSLPFRL